MAKGGVESEDALEFEHLSTEFTEMLSPLTPLQARFALWYFDPDRIGTQKAWARDNNVNPATLSYWKAADWFVALADRWAVIYGARFHEVVRTLFQKATDKEDFQSVQAARTLAELLQKFPTKTIKHEFSMADYLKGEVRREEPRALPEGITVVAKEVTDEAVHGQHAPDHEQDLGRVPRSGLN